MEVVEFLGKNLEKGGIDTWHIPFLQKPFNIYNRL